MKKSQVLSAYKLLYRRKPRNKIWKGHNGMGLWLSLLYSYVFIVVNLES
jgi:hypothetical protein